MRFTSWASLFVALLFAVFQPELVRAQQGEINEAREQAQEMMTRFDDDKDGKLTIEELMTGIRALADEGGHGQDELEEYEERMRRLFPKADREGDGKLDL